MCAVKISREMRPRIFVNQGAMHVNFEELGSCTRILTTDFVLYMGSDRAECGDFQSTLYTNFARPRDELRQPC